MVHDPLSPSEALRTRLGTVLAAVSVFTLVYSILIGQLLLFGVVVFGFLTVGPYLSYRLFVALDALADAAQRNADTRERELDRETRFGSLAEREASSEDRVRERER